MQAYYFTIGQSWLFLTMLIAMVAGCAAPAGPHRPGQAAATAAPAKELVITMWA